VGREEINSNAQSHIATACFITTQNGNGLAKSLSTLAQANSL
jgi:hypothetical protein